MLGLDCGRRDDAVLDAGVAKQKSDRHLDPVSDRMTMTIRPVGIAANTNTVTRLSHRLKVSISSQAGRLNVLATRNEQVAAMSLSGAHADKDLASRA